MAIKSDYSPEEFAQLAKTDTLAWVEIFRNAKIHDVYVEVSYLKDVCAVDFHGCSIACVDSEGGYEGGGDHASRVFAILSNRDERLAYFRITGFYSSYNGTEWDGEIEVVYPHEVMVIQYTTSP